MVGLKMLHSENYFRFLDEKVQKIKRLSSHYLSLNFSEFF